MNATSAATRATIPMSVEITFIITDLWLSAFHVDRHARFTAPCHASSPKRSPEALSKALPFWAGKFRAEALVFRFGKGVMPTPKSRLAPGEGSLRLRMPVLRAISRDRAVALGGAV